MVTHLRQYGEDGNGGNDLGLAEPTETGTIGNYHSHISAFCQRVNGYQSRQYQAGRKEPFLLVMLDGEVDTAEFLNKHTRDVRRLGGVPELGKYRDCSLLECDDGDFDYVMGMHGDIDGARIVGPDGKPARLGVRLIYDSEPSESESMKVCRIKQEAGASNKSSECGMRHTSGLGISMVDGVGVASVGSESAYSAIHLIDGRVDDGLVWTPRRSGLDNYTDASSAATLMKIFLGEDGYRTFKRSPIGRALRYLTAAEA